MILSGMAALGVAGSGGRLRAHPVHGVHLVTIEVIHARARGRDLDLRLAVTAHEAGRSLEDALLLGAIVDRRALPVALEKGVARPVDLSVLFPAAVPADFRLELVIGPEGGRQALPLRLDRP